MIKCKLFICRKLAKAGLFCSKSYLLHFWAVLKKLLTHYAQYYAHKCFNYATVDIQLYYFNDYISKVRLQPVVLYIMIRCSALKFYILCSWEDLCLILYHVVHDYYIASILLGLSYKSGDKHVNGLTNDDFLIDYTDHLVVTFNSWDKSYTYYAGIMLDAFNNLLCSNVCQYNIGLGLKLASVLITGEWYNDNTVL